MGAASFAALAVNAAVALMLYRLRTGDATHAFSLDLHPERVAFTGR